jgi:hypothetical protein
MCRQERLYGVFVAGPQVLVSNAMCVKDRKMCAARFFVNSKQLKIQPFSNFNHYLRVFLTAFRCLPLIFFTYFRKRMIIGATFERFFAILIKVSDILMHSFTSFRLLLPLFAVFPSFFFFILAKRMTKGTTFLRVLGFLIKVSDILMHYFTYRLYLSVTVVVAVAESVVI